MKTNIKQGIVSGAFALSLLGGSAAGVAAQQGGQEQNAGAAGLVNAVVAVAADLDNTTIEVVTVDIRDSFNNLRALNNILNNSPILSNNNIEVVDVVDVSEVDIELLRNANIVISDVIAVAILSGGDLVVLT